MANRAHNIPTPDVHPLTGSSPPGSAPPFEPVASSTHPRDQAHATWLDEVSDSCFNRATHPERELIRLCGDADDLALSDKAAWKAVEDLDLDEETNPRLAHARGTSAAVRQASASLSNLRARTPEGLAAKAAFLMDVLFEDDRADPIKLAAVAGDHADCLRSFLDDARWIGSCSRFTIAKLVGLQENPPVQAPEEGWGFRHLIQDWAYDTLNNSALAELFDRLADTKPLISPPDELFVRAEDERLFKLPEGGEPFRGRGQIYAGSAQIEALYNISAEDSLNLGASINEKRQKRASEIIDASHAYLTAKAEQDRLLGLTDYRRQAHWQNENERGLRQRILSTPVRTLDGLLLKTLVMADCMCDSPAAAAAELEDDLIEKNKTGKTNNEVIAASIILDLVRILVSREITVRSVAGHFELDRPPLAEAAEASSRAA